MEDDLLRRRRLTVRGGWMALCLASACSDPAQILVITREGKEPVRRRFDDARACEAVRVALDAEQRRRDADAHAAITASAARRAVEAEARGAKACAEATAEAARCPGLEPLERGTCVIVARHLERACKEAPAEVERLRREAAAPPPPPSARVTCSDE